MSYARKATHSIMCDHITMQPRYNPGDTLFLKPLSAPPCITAEAPDVCIVTAGGQIAIGNLVTGNTDSIQIRQLTRTDIITIPLASKPILYEIIGAISGKITTSPAEQITNSL